MKDPARTILISVFIVSAFLTNDIFIKFGEIIKRKPEINQSIWYWVGYAYKNGIGKTLKKLH